MTDKENLSQNIHSSKPTDPLLISKEVITTHTRIVGDKKDSQVEKQTSTHPPDKGTMNVPEQKEHFPSDTTTKAENISHAGQTSSMGTQPTHTLMHGSNYSAQPQHYTSGSNINQQHSSTTGSTISQMGGASTDQMGTRSSNTESNIGTSSLTHQPDTTFKGDSSMTSNQSHVQHTGTQSQRSCPVSGMTRDQTQGMTSQMSGQNVSHGMRPSEQASMEGMEMFERPMQEYFKHLYDISRVFPISLALRHNIFDAIGSSEGMNVKTLLDKLGFKTPERRFIDLLDELHFSGFLNRQGLLDDAIYSLTDYTKRFFLKNSLGDYPLIYRNLERLIKRFEDFEKGLPSGKTTKFTDDIFDTTEDTMAYFSYFDKSNEMNFQHLINTYDFSRFKRILVIHGGRGQLAMMIKKKCPMGEITTFENSKMKTMTESFIKANNMQDSIKMEFGDLLTSTLPDSDCVVFPHILMHFNYDNRKKILKNIYDKMSLGGECVILENLIDSQRQRDSCGMKISFLMGLHEGHVCSFEEYRDCLQAVGFKDIQLQNNQAQGQGICDIIVARR